MTDYEPPATIEFDTLEELDVLSSPFRLRLLECFYPPTTVKLAARRLDVPTTRLYHHVNLLLDHGFLVVVDERPKGAVVERVLGVGARAIGPSEAFLDRYGLEGKRESIAFALKLAQAEIDAAIEHLPLTEDEDDRRMSFALTHLRITREDLVRLIRDMEGLMERYGEADGPVEVGFLHAVYDRGELPE